MQLKAFLEGVKAGENVGFHETLSVISEYYHYQPTEFCNGLDEPLINPAGQNEGSCKIFAFARLHDLSREQTLQLFGDYYRIDVLNTPDASDHLNIRRFMRDGWEGIDFRGVALQAI